MPSKLKSIDDLPIPKECPIEIKSLPREVVFDLINFLTAEEGLALGYQTPVTCFENFSDEQYPVAVYLHGQLKNAEVLEFSKLQIILAYAFGTTKDDEKNLARPCVLEVFDYNELMIILNRTDFSTIKDSIIRGEIKQELEKINDHFKKNRKIDTFEKEKQLRRFFSKLNPHHLYILLTEGILLSKSHYLILATVLEHKIKKIVNEFKKNRVEFIPIRGTRFKSHSSIWMMPGLFSSEASDGSHKLLMPTEKFRNEHGCIELNYSSDDFYKLVKKSVINTLNSKKLERNISRTDIASYFLLCLIGLGSISTIIVSALLKYKNDFAVEIDSNGNNTFAQRWPCAEIRTTHFQTYQNQTFYLDPLCPAMQPGSVYELLGAMSHNRQLSVINGTDFYVATDPFIELSKSLALIFLCVLPIMIATSGYFLLNLCYRTYHCITSFLTRDIDPNKLCQKGYNEPSTASEKLASARCVTEFFRDFSPTTRQTTYIEVGPSIV